MGRPLGVTILGAGMILAGLGFAATGVIFFFMGSTGAAATAPENGAMATVLAALGAAAGVIFLLFGALHVVLANAIFKLRNLGRILTIFLFMLIAAGACLGLIATLLSYSHHGLLWNGSFSLWICLHYGICCARRQRKRFTHSGRVQDRLRPVLLKAWPSGKGRVPCPHASRPPRSAAIRCLLDGWQHFAPGSARRRDGGVEDAGTGRPGPGDRWRTDAVRSEPSGNQRDGGLFRLADGRNSKRIHAFGFRPFPRRSRLRDSAAHRGHGGRENSGRAR